MQNPFNKHRKATVTGEAERYRSPINADLTFPTTR